MIPAHETSLQKTKTKNKPKEKQQQSEKRKNERRWERECVDAWMDGRIERGDKGRRRHCCTVGSWKGKERKKEREREPESHRLMKCPKQQQQPNINVYTRKYVCIYK